MRTLPKPLPDELLYSVLARATYRYGFWSPKQLLDLVYGRRTVAAVPDLPSNLLALAGATVEAWNMSVEELALRHTLVGYYTHFKGVVSRKSALVQMAFDGGSIHLQLGVCAGAARVPKRFRLCPTCHAYDIAAYGESYWHRAHHLPGVLVCHKHGDILLETDHSFHPPARHVYAAAPLAVNMSALAPLVPGLTRAREAQTVAAYSVHLLESTACAPSPRPDYRVVFENLGWRRGQGRLKEVQQAFLDFFGPDLFQASFTRTDCDPVAWLVDATRAPRRDMHPFKHVLLSVFLQGQADRTQGATPEPMARSGAKSWRVYADPHLRDTAVKLAGEGRTTNAVARALNVDWKTADRLLQPLPEVARVPERDVSVDRKRWEDLAHSKTGIGKKQMRTQAPALYARLYRNDRDWLLSQDSQAAYRQVNARRVNWKERDAIVEASVRTCVEQVLAVVPIRRASRSYVLGKLGLRALVAHRRLLLPRTCAALNELCETVEAFQVRRLATVLSRLPDTAPTWQILRTAGIEPCRFSDGARSLIHQATLKVRDLPQYGGANRGGA